MFKQLFNAFADSSGSLDFTEIGAAGGLFTYLGLTIANYVQHSVMPNGVEFAGAVGAIVGLVATARRLRGDAEIDVARAKTANGNN